MLPLDHVLPMAIYIFALAGVNAIQTSEPTPSRLGLMELHDMLEGCLI